MKEKWSAYRQFHSTEAAPLLVNNGMLIVLDQRNGINGVVYLLAAFETIDHNILLMQIESRFGITRFCL